MESAWLVWVVLAACITGLLLAALMGMASREDERAAEGPVIGAIDVESEIHGF